MSDRVRLFGGTCTTEFVGTRSRTQRGRVIVLVKPDDTVLVHDADGYQPVAWLTRAESVSVECDITDGTDRSGDTSADSESRKESGSDSRKDSHPDSGKDSLSVSGNDHNSDDSIDNQQGNDTDPGDSGDSGSKSKEGDKDSLEFVEAASFTITAQSGDQLLTVDSEGPGFAWSAPIDVAGVPVGECGIAGCAGSFVRTGGEVVCLECEQRYGLPTGATVLDSRCDECGLPQIRVERGEAFEICLDYACESLNDRIREQFDRLFDCPDCGDPLRIRVVDGRAFFGCADYPDCEAAYSIPDGVVVGQCPCGLPIFETATGRRCLDTSCERGRS